MKICEGKVNEQPDWKTGNLYKLEGSLHDCDGEVFLASQGNTLIGISDGLRWNKNDGFGSHGSNFRDVTNEYCLKRITDDI